MEIVSLFEKIVGLIVSALSSKISFVDTTYRGLYESRNGASHSPHGEIRFLVAFIELVYEDTNVVDPDI